MTGDDKRDATWWAEIEESLGHLDAAERYRQGGIVPPGQLWGGSEGDELLLPPVTPGWRVLQPDRPGQRCACSAPDDPLTSPHRASGRAGERVVCPHGKAWKLVDPGVGQMFLRWVELHGLARWWAARKARR